MLCPADCGEGRDIPSVILGEGGRGARSHDSWLNAVKALGNDGPNLSAWLWHAGPGGMPGWDQHGAGSVKGHMKDTRCISMYVRREHSNF